MTQPTTPPTLDDLIGSDEAATILGYAHRSSVLRAVTAGVLTDYNRRPGRIAASLLLDRRQVEHVAASRRIVRDQ